MKWDTQGFFGPRHRLSTNVEDRRGIWDDDAFRMLMRDWRDAAQQRQYLFSLHLNGKQATREMLERHTRAVLDLMQRKYLSYGSRAPNARTIEFRYVATEHLFRVEVKNTATGTVFYVPIGAGGELGAVEHSLSGWHREARVP